MASSNIYTSVFDEDVQTDNQTNGCPECGGCVETNTVETVCEACGLVLAEHAIDHSGEPVYDDETERTGAPLTTARHDRGLSTMIGRQRDAKGNTLSAKKRRQLGRLRREQKRGRFRSKQERNLSHGLGEVQRIASVLDVDDTLQEQACQLFRSAHSEGLLLGRSIEAVAAASVYAACRCNGRTLPLADVVEAAHVGENRVTNAYATLNEELGLPAEPMQPHAYLPRLASNLDVPDAVRRQARTLAERAEETQIVHGASPPGFAAACLYQAAQRADYRLTQAAVADVAGVAANTVRGHRDTLSNELE
ncbi:transcription initiation factor IIB [Halarchaeum nitratireducens]|uniref:Transcription initiation factor IIB n=1 Tax=Halarchaeum nitratireducens TaxID=489913 RepID=A0A830GG62_9EURY|nr:transcription initiation factor IIB family protein [Halarchaeum nitratireducens]GGN25453.1 transcription initiation factor IIB [Halarchaeum nitratireducens]